MAVLFVVLMFLGALFFNIFLLPIIVVIVLGMIGISIALWKVVILFMLARLIVNFFK